MQNRAYSPGLPDPSRLSYACTARVMHIEQKRQGQETILVVWVCARCMTLGSHCEF